MTHLQKDGHTQMVCIPEQVIAKNQQYSQLMRFI